MTENLCQWEFCFPSFESPCYFGWSKTFNDPVIGNASAWGLLTFIIILFYQVFCCKMCNQSRQHPHQWQRSVNWLLFKLQKTLETPVFILYLVIFSLLTQQIWLRLKKCKETVLSYNWNGYPCEFSIYKILFSGMFLRISPDVLQKFSIIKKLKPSKTRSLINNCMDISHKFQCHY